MGCFSQAADFLGHWQAYDPLDLVDLATWYQFPTDILEFRRILACWDLELDLVDGFPFQIQIRIQFSPQLLAGRFRARGARCGDLPRLRPPTTLWGVLK